MSMRWAISACLLWFGAPAAVATEPLQEEESLGRDLVRGELLYSLHCITCHTADLHWRRNSLVKDWRSLKVQIRRWQEISSLNWSDADIDATARYLSVVHYRKLPNR